MPKSPNFRRRAGVRWITPPGKKKSKYANKKTTDGFDSKKEAHRYQILKALENAGKIKDLQTQVKYELIPKQDGERAINYFADFVYYDEFGALHVEDVKGYRTDVYIIKRKLMLWRHNIKILEI